MSLTEKSKDAADRGGDSMPRTLLGPGAHGGLVAAVQQALLNAGFDPNGVDGTYGGNTAVRPRPKSKR